MKKLITNSSHFLNPNGQGSILQNLFLWLLAIYTIKDSISRMFLFCFRLVKLIQNCSLFKGQGLRIESVHPSDEGIYICEAKNLMGSITTLASLNVREPPVISVKPQAHLQLPKGSPVSLSCMVTGSPKPAVYWTHETSGGTSESVMIMPGTRHKNMYVASDNALKIEDPSLENSGHYSCSALNDVGSALARSHLVIYDPEDFGPKVRKGRLFSFA